MSTSGGDHEQGVHVCWWPGFGRAQPTWHGGGETIEEASEPAWMRGKIWVRKCQPRDFSGNLPIHGFSWVFVGSRTALGGWWRQDRTGGMFQTHRDLMKPVLLNQDLLPIWNDASKQIAARRGPTNLEEAFCHTILDHRQTIASQPFGRDVSLIRHYLGSLPNDSVIETT